VDGDPDRPVIAGAVPNPETASPVTAANQTESVIQTGGNNKIRIQDFLGSERIIMETPAANSWIRVGTPNDPPASRTKKLKELVETYNFIKDKDPSKGIKIKTEGNYIAESEGHQKVILDDVRDPAPQFQLSNDTIIEIYNALVALKKKRDDDYDAIQEPKGKTKFEPKKLSDDDIKNIIECLDPNNKDSYPPTPITEENEDKKGKPSPYEDKQKFIDTIKGKEEDNSDSELKVKVTSDWEEKKEAIIRIILQHAEDSNAWKRTVDIEGEQFYMTDGCHKIEAINGDLKFEMTDGGIIIDSGDKDVTIKCRKFNVINELEDNTTFSDDLLYHYGNTEEYTYGTSYSEFHGASKEKFYGDKEETHSGTLEEYFYGNKFGHTFSSVEDFHEGHKLETFVGSQEEFSFIHSLAFFLGIKEEISLSLALSIGLGVSLDIKNVLELEMKGIHIQKTGVELENKVAQIQNGQIEISQHLMKIHT